jgi:hypothetical protein
LNGNRFFIQEGQEGSDSFVRTNIKRLLNQKSVPMKMSFRNEGEIEAFQVKEN